MPDLVCLTLHAPRSLADRLNDFLLDHESMTSEFSTCDVRFHGTELGGRSPSEQILGHARQVQVSVIIASAQADRLLQELGQFFPGCGLTYWIGPVLKSGIIQ
jgi:Protein of unknown function (DUF3240)